MIGLRGLKIGCEKKVKNWLESQTKITIFVVLLGLLHP